MAGGVTSVSNNPYIFFKDITPNRILSRVKFGGDIPYDGVSPGTIVADTNKCPDLAGLTVDQLKMRVDHRGDFLFAENRNIYKVHDGTAIEIPLFRTSKMCIVGVYAVITESLTGSGTLSVGVPGDAQIVLGNQTVASLAIPSGGSTVIWIPEFPYSSAAPYRSKVKCGWIYYSPDRQLAPGNTVYLKISGGTVTAGDITFEILGVPMGLESYGETGAIMTSQLFRSANFGKTLDPIFPYWDMP